MVKILALVKKSLWLITTCLLCLIDRFLMHVHHLSCRCINLKMDLSNNITRNVARFRIRGHGLKWNPDKALHYTEHLGHNTEGHNTVMKAIERKDVEAANNYLRAMIISAACNSNLGNFSGIFRLAFFIGRIKGWQLEPERLLGLMMYAGEREGIIYAL